MGYSGGSGGSSSAAITKIKASNTARPNNIVPAADPDLVLQDLPIGNYTLEGIILWQTNATADIACNIRGSIALPTSYFWWLMKGAGNAVPFSIAQGPQDILANDSTAVWQTPDTNVYGAILSGSLIIAAVNTISFIWAQNTSNAVATSVLAGSWIRATLVE